MMRFVQVALAAFFVAFANPSFADTRLQEQALAPLAQLNRTCSAAIVYSGPAAKSEANRTLLLTAKHCVRNGSARVQTVNVPVYHGNRLVSEVAYKARVASQDWTSDLALLELIDTETILDTLASVAPADLVLSEGETVWTVGYSRGMSRVVTPGTFGNRESINFPVKTKDTEYFRATPQIAGGNSGGMLFRRTSEGDYEIIGVTAAVIPASDFMGFYVPVDQIDKFLRRVAPEMYPKDDAE